MNDKWLSRDGRPSILLLHKINSKNFLQVQLQLWKDLWADLVKAPRLTDKIKYIIMPPGWNHIDGGKMAGAYRSEAEEARKLDTPKENIFV